MRKCWRKSANRANGRSAQTTCRQRKGTPVDNQVDLTDDCSKEATQQANCNNRWTDFISVELVITTYKSWKKNCVSDDKCGIEYLEECRTEYDQTCGYNQVSRYPGI